MAYVCVLGSAIGLNAPGVSCAAEGAGFDEEIEVVSPTPGGTAGIALDRFPFNVQAADADALERTQSLDLTDYLGTHLGSVSINSAQNNPLQPDVQYRGYTASPLLGLPMGIAVYQNGARINEPLSDAVNWDLLPESAVHSMTLIGGANPLFGLNTLGGALSIEMKNGFNFQGHQVEAMGGSWERVVTSAESGANNGVLGYYVNVHYFDEGGWRDQSESDAVNVFASLSYRGETTDVDVSFQFGDSELRGNGASPIGLLQLDREAIFTAPDITENDMHMFTFGGSHGFSATTSLDLNAFYRNNKTDSFNGDLSEFLACELTGGQFLVEGIEQDDLDELGLDGNDICADNVLGVADPGALETVLNGLVPMGQTGFSIDDRTSSLSGTGVIVDDAINNTSDRAQESYGTDWQLTFLNDVFRRSNFFVVGFSYNDGEADFNSVLELANIDPVTRNTAGLGVGTFVDDAATMVTTSTSTWSVYFLDSIELTDALTLTVGGRYNDTQVELRDRSGRRPELNGDHAFRRFNPSVGVTYDVLELTNFFASYSESSRAPTPIELSCNDGVFQIARDAAAAAGADPDDVRFECRLPNAFLADPPLDDAVAKSVELGFRGEIGAVRHRLGYFRTVNNDDIIFQTTGRATGLFANVEETQREGFESAFAASFGNFDFSTSYSYIRATFASDFLVLSPQHPFANDGGEIQVRNGDRIPGIPEHQFKFSAMYSLPWNIRLGAELVYNSDQVLRGDESNQLDPVDGYSVFNMRASYAHNAHVELFARVSNLFNEAYENFGLLGEDPGQALPGLTNRSPVFLGAGAERGVWIGVRLRLR